MESPRLLCVFFFNDTATTEIYTLSLHDALPISPKARPATTSAGRLSTARPTWPRSEEHTSELQSLRHLVCRLLLEKIKAERCHFSAAAGLSQPGPRLQSGLRRGNSVLRQTGARRLDFFFFNDTATTEIYTLSLHDALPI